MYCSSFLSVFLSLMTVSPAFAGATNDPAEVLPVDVVLWENVEWPSLIYGVEGDRYHISPSVAANMDVTVCEEHFPVGSQGRTNIETAVQKLNDLSTVDLNWTVVEGPHRTPTELYATPPLEDYRIEITDQGSTGVLTSTGATFHYVDPQLLDMVPGSWDCCDDLDGTESEAAVVTLLSSRYDAYSQALCAGSYNGPHCVRNLTSSNAVDLAPSVGVIAHEIGHTLSMGHPYADSNNPAYEEYRNYMWEYQSLTVSRGQDLNGNLRAPYHGDSSSGFRDLRIGEISAYSRALLEHFYGSATPSIDTVPEWYNHEVLIIPQANGVVDDTDIFPFEDYNPKFLYYDAASDEYLDCNTDALPIYTMQASDASTYVESASDPDDIALLFAMIQSDGTWGRIEWAEVDTSPVEADYVQFNWQTDLEITGAKFGVPLVSQERYLRSRVDGFQEYTEGDESDNDVQMSVVLYRNKSDCYSAPVQGLPGSGRSQWWWWNGELPFLQEGEFAECLDYHP